MYSGPHTAISYPLMVTTLEVSNYSFTGYAVASLIGFVSHYFVDYLGEKPMSLQEAKKYDMLPSGLIFLLSFIYMFSKFNISWHLITMPLSVWFFPNLMDIIDKKLYLSILIPKKYKSTEYFHNQTWRYQFTLKQTKKWGFYSVAIVFITLIYFLISNNL